MILEEVKDLFEYLHPVQIGACLIALRSTQRSEHSYAAKDADIEQAYSDFFKAYPDLAILQQVYTFSDLRAVMPRPESDLDIAWQYVWISSVLPTIEDKTFLCEKLTYIESCFSSSLSRIKAVSLDSPLTELMNQGLWLIASCLMIFCRFYLPMSKEERTEAAVFWTDVLNIITNQKLLMAIPLYAPMFSRYYGAIILTVPKKTDAIRACLFVFMSCTKYYSDYFVNFVMNLVVKSDFFSVLDTLPQISRELSYDPFMSTKHQTVMNSCRQSILTFYIKVQKEVKLEIIKKLYEDCDDDEVERRIFEAVVDNKFCVQIDTANDIIKIEKSKASNQMSLMERSDHLLTRLKVLITSLKAD